MINISFDAGVTIGNNLFVSERQFNALLKIELNTGEVKYISSFAEEREVCTDLHRKALKYKNSIIFIPQRAQYIAVFNLNTYDISFIDIQRKSRVRTLFSDCFIIDDTLWLFPAVMEQALLKINLKTQNIVEERILNKKLYDANVPETQIITKVCKIKDQVFFAIFDTSKIACYNIKTQEVFINETKIRGVDTVYAVDGELWISNQSGNEIYLYDPDTKCVIENDIVTQDLERGSNQVVSSKNGEVFLVPDYGREILKRNEVSKIFESQKGLVIKSGVSP